MGILHRIGNLFQKSRVNREIEAELRAHIEMRTEENMAAGMGPDQARRDALVRFGNPASTRERVAGADAALSLDNVAADLRYSWRQLRHSPGFAITAALTLAVAIAANAIIFVMNALVLRPLNLPGARSLYSIENEGEPSISYPDYRDLRDRNRSFDGIALYNFNDVGFDTGGAPRRAWIYEASGNYFGVPNESNGKYPNIAES